MSELRKHYESQETEILLDIAKGDLTEIARKTIREVLVNRGVSNQDIEATELEAKANKAEPLKKDPRLASLGKRLIAFIIDFLGANIIALLIAFALNAITGGDASDLLKIIFFGYFLLRDSIPGQGFGKRILHIKVIDADSNKNCTWYQSMTRNLLHIFFIVDMLFALGEKRKRLGDYAAGTIVIDRNKALTHHSSGTPNGAP